MKTQKPLAVRIFIRICVIAMVVSLVWVYVVYMFTPSQTVEENSWDVSEDVNVEIESVTEIIPEVNPENPDESAAPILITEDWEINELDQVIEYTLNNWETELVRAWDLNDAIQIN